MGLKDSKSMHEINDIKINTIYYTKSKYYDITGSRVVGVLSFTISAHQNYYSYSFVEPEPEPELVGVVFGIEE